MEESQKEETYDESIISQLLSFGVGDRNQIINAMDNVVNKDDINDIVDYLKKEEITTNNDNAANNDKIESNDKNTEKATTNDAEPKPKAPNNSNNDDVKTEEKNKDCDNTEHVIFPVSVYVRMRPLVGDEVKNNHKAIDYSLKTNKKSKKQSISFPEDLRNENIKKKGSKRNKKYSGFMAVIAPKFDNLHTFNQCIAPSLEYIMNGVSTCAFAYGHTGSGKTHTIFGYGDTHPGMYRLFAQSLCERVQALKNDTVIEIRFTELYFGTIRDLLSKEKLECFLREDDKGNVHLRGQTVKYEKTGKVVVKPITSFQVTTPSEIDKYIGEGMASRNVGKSTLHDKSSRSHAFLEFELVNKELVDARIELPDFQAQKDVFQRKYDIVKKGAGGNKSQLPKMEKKMQKLKTRIKALKKVIKSLENHEYRPYLGGKYVFVDLAGNEYGRDVKSNDKNEEKERNEINKSLFALKECIRGLHDKNGKNKNKRVPYRSSKLTMYLRRYLKGDGSKAIMITNIGPSNQYVKQTINTLQYCQLVAKA